MLYWSTYASCTWSTVPASWASPSDRPSVRLALVPSTVRYQLTDIVPVVPFALPPGTA
jgi:hypothetical protein